MSNPESPVQVDEDLGSVRVRLQLPAGSAEIPTGDDESGARRTGWITPDGVSVVCEVLSVAADQAHAVDVVMGAVIHTYEQREGAKVRNVTRLAVAGAQESIGYALVTPRDGAAVDHRMIVAGRAEAAADQVGLLQVSWQGIGDDVAPEQAASFDAILRTWELGARNAA